MITVVSGIRDLPASGVPDVELAVREVIVGSDEVRLGGALGVDTAALGAACESDARCVVYVPFGVRDQPRDARQVIERSGAEVAELDLPRGRSAFLRRNDSMLHGAHQLVAFTDGREDGGTAYTIRAAKRLGLPVEIVWVTGGATEITTNPIERTLESVPVVGCWKYVSASETGGEAGSAVSALIRDMKAGEGDPLLVARLAQRMADYIRERQPQLMAADVIVPMPRRKPGVESDLAELAKLLAWHLGKTSWPDYLVRTSEPMGGKVEKGRMRFPADEHARTLRVPRPLGPGRTVLLLDNVLTTGGTMAGAIRAVRAGDQASVVGLSILYSAHWEREA
jgi:predicted amidophosphoribosyltransferase